MRAFNEGENVSIQSTGVIESKFPLRILVLKSDQIAVVRANFAAAWVCSEIEILTDRANLSVLSDRNIIPPAGVCGGLSGLQTGTLCSVMVMKLVQASFPEKLPILS